MALFLRFSDSLRAIDGNEEFLSLGFERRRGRDGKITYMNYCIYSTANSGVNFYIDSPFDKVIRLVR